MDVQTCAELSCNLQLRNAASVLEQQLSAVYDDEFYHRPETQIPRLHPMSADIDVATHEASEENTQSCKKPKSIWNTAPEDKLQTVVGFENIYIEGLRHC